MTDRRTATWLPFTAVVQLCRPGGRRVSRWTVWRLAKRLDRARRARGDLPILRPRRGRGGGLEVWLEQLEAEARDSMDDAEDQSEALDWRLRGIERTQRRHGAKLREHGERIQNHDRDLAAQRKSSELLGRAVSALTELQTMLSATKPVHK